MKDDTIKLFLKKNPTIDVRELNWRIDGRLEWICECGVGHTVYAPENSDFVHGCDGCCEKIIILEGKGGNKNGRKPKKQ